MRPFEYRHVATQAQALAEGLRDGRSRYLAGGTTLVDIMRQEIERPERVIDINALSLNRIDQTPRGLRIGALVRMSELAAHPGVAAQYPAVSQALLASASPQIRNMASIGGNLMQRTRCSYFRDLAMPCNKREPRSGCGAIGGNNRSHAILGGSAACVAVHSSDLAVALLAFDADVAVAGPSGGRRIRMADFYKIPGETPNIETALGLDEMIIGIDLPTSETATRSQYLKVRDRSSYEFALVSVAAAVKTTSSGMIQDVRIALGGVGTKPWRASAAEEKLIGGALTAASIHTAAEAALAGAVPLRDNGFKIVLARNAVRRVLADLGEAA